MLNQDTISKIYDFEKSEGYPKDSLLNVMIFETAGTLLPSIQNKYTSATGLIQFMPSTAISLGTTITALKGMSVNEQLIYVRKYLIPYRAKLLATKDPLDFYLAILYPALMGKDDSALMASDRNTAIYKQNSGLDFNKDGKISKGDIRNYFANQVASVRLKNDLPDSTTAILNKKFPLAAVAIIAALLLIFS